jgi:hypothetical protein
MTAKAHKMWRRGIAQVTIFGLIFQAAMSAFMLPMPLMQAAVAAASHGQEIVICTSLGFERISLGTAGDAGKGNQPAGAEGCPVCVALAPAAAADLPVIQTNLPQEFQPAPVPQSAADRCPAQLTVLTQHNRGPPLA